MSNPAPRCSCIVCREEKSSKGIHSHYLTAHTKEGNARVISSGKLGKALQIQANKLKPTVEKVLQFTCRNCGLLTNNPQFCSRLCYYTHAKNTKRGHRMSQQTRDLISASLKRKGVRGKRITPISFCIICNNCFEGYMRKTCSNECLHVAQSLSAHKSNLGANGQRQGKNYFVEDSYGEIKRLESSYEFKTYEILRSLSIKWTRPKFINYTMNGKAKRYFPDFYLPDYNIYLDPKNDYLIEKDKDKIKTVIEQSMIQLYVLSFEMIKQNYIQCLVGLSGYAPDPSEFQSDASTRLA